MPYKNWTATIVALFPLAFAVNAQDIKDFDPLFAAQHTLEVEVEGPFALLAKERSDVEEVAGILRYTAEDGSPVEFEVAIRARGNWRRNPDICKFPPLRLNFKKSETKDTLFHKQDKLKLVTHCRNSPRRYQQTVVSEYLAYRIFNLLTDTSYRVRLLKIKYVYTDAELVTDAYAVFIEHKDRLGKRIGGKPSDVEKVPLADLRREDLNLASVFQFFVGNTDFSPIATAPDEDCCHNQALFTSGDGPHFTIPYDFDQAGLINAPHATPNPRFGLRTVTERLYRGRCANNDLLPATLELFRENRSAIEALLLDQADLTSATRRNMRMFVNSFYKTIDSPRRVERILVKRCI